MEAVFLSQAEQVARWELVKQLFIQNDTINFSKKLPKWSMISDAGFKKQLLFGSGVSPWEEQIQMQQDRFV